MCASLLVSTGSSTLTRKVAMAVARFPPVTVFVLPMFQKLFVEFSILSQTSTHKVCRVRMISLLYLPYPTATHQTLSHPS
jgi:hypothetical protein